MRGMRAANEETMAQNHGSPNSSLWSEVAKKEQRLYFRITDITNNNHRDNSRFKTNASIIY